MSIHLPYKIDESVNRHHFYETHWKHVALDLLAAHTDLKGLRMLDYGCGRGELIDFASKRGMIAEGTDLDPECVQLAAAYGPTSLLKAEDPVGQFGEANFDVITCLHVLEHVPSPLQVMNDLGAMTSKYLILAVPNLRNLTNLTKRKIDLNLVNPGHLQSWDHWHFLNLATRHCGLELVEWGFDATILPGISNGIRKILPLSVLINLETGLFKKLFPFHGISVLGLFKVPDQTASKLDEIDGTVEDERTSSTG